MTEQRVGNSVFDSGIPVSVRSSDQAA